MSNFLEQVENVYSEELITGIQFSVFSPDDIRNGSVCEILIPDTYDGTEPKPNGLFDPRMGVIDEGRKCLTCEQTSDLCPGHFGHVELALPLYNIQYIGFIIKILKCVCFRCSNLLISKSDPIILGQIGKKSGKNRFDAVYEMLNTSQKQKKCKYNDGCFVIQPKNYKMDKYDKSITSDKNSVIRIIAEFSQEALKDPKISNPKQTISAEVCYNILSRLTDEDCRFLGLSSMFGRPEWMLWTVFPIPPPQVRPSIRKDNNQRSEDDLTHVLFNIIKDNRILKQKIETESKKEIIDNYYALLQYRVICYVDNEIPSIPHITHRSGRPLKTLVQRLKGKEGRMRGNLMGKRVDYSARTVISVDTNISIDEYGVPKPIMMNLTYPEIATKYNKQELTKLVRNGQDEYPGAKLIERVEYDCNGRPAPCKMLLKYVQDREKLVVKEGDIVHRHLQNSDIGLFNRQPSLHRMSMMAMKTRMLRGNTFRLNVSVTKPFNADFDGDEMNMHVPQSIRTRVELEELTMVPTQIVSPGNCKPIIQIVQDSLTGVYLLSQDNVRITRNQLMNLMMENKDYDGRVLEPVFTGTGEWSGDQIFSMILPEISIEMKNDSGEKVIIKGGNYMQGSIDKSVLGAKGISQNIYNIFGIGRTHRFLDTTQLMITRWLEKNSFSIGMGDCRLQDPEAAGEITKIITKGLHDVERILTEAQQGLYFPKLDNFFRRQQLEAHIKKYLTESSTGVYNYINSKIDKFNGYNVTVKSGSKGSTVNIRQIIGCLGQQDIWGSRVENGYTDRTLSQFSKYDYGAKCRGYIEDSFFDGLNGSEFFFHMMTGRTGLIDTAVRTADSGYTSRKLLKSAEDLKVLYDGTVRNANNNIIQFKYGDDGFDPIMLENQELQMIQWSNVEMEKKYKYLAESEMEWAVITTSSKYIDKKVLEEEYEKLLECREILRGKYYKNIDVITGIKVYLPFNLTRFILYVKTKFSVKDYAISDLSPMYVIKTINELCEFINKYSKEAVNNELTKIAIRTYLASKQCIVQHKLNKEAFDYIVDRVRDKIIRSYVQPGEMVGPIAAQSLGESSTQMTLNTFHLSGDASKSVVVTAGLPRLKEILNISPKIKTPSMLIYLREEYTQSKEKAELVKNMLEYTVMEDIIIKTETIYDDYEKDNKSISNQEDLEFMEIYREFNEIICADVHSGLSKWGLRIEFNKELMMNKNITMMDVQDIILRRFTSEDAVQCVISDDNSNNLMMRIRVRHEDERNYLEEMNSIEKMIKATEIKGIQGIRKVGLEEKNIVKYNVVDGSYVNKKEWTLNTDGSNLIALYDNEYIDTYRTTTNDILEIYRLFGIEAVRRKIIEEFLVVFAESDINYRHIAIIADVMTYRGVLMQIDRHGVNRSSDYGPITKASFEEIDDILVNAAIFGEYDKMTSVSANIMVGQMVPAGTNMSDILLDEDKLMKIVKKKKEEVIEVMDPININEHIEKIYEKPSEEEVKDEDFDFRYNVATVQEHRLSEIKMQESIEPVKIVETTGVKTTGKATKKIKITKKK